MIQRIQTLYLLAVIVISGFLFFYPIADLINKVDNLVYLVDFKAITQIQPTGNTIESRVWGLTAISALIPIISLITIFSFKNRMNQIRLTVINMFLIICFYLVLFFYLWTACQRLQTDWNLRIVAVLPLINLILNYLAIGAIGKDENLIKSLNRLR